MMLARYVLQRLAAAALTLFGALVLLFAVIQLVPGDLITIMFGPRATPELRAEYAARMGTDQPVWMQLWMFIRRTATGDLGTDVISGRPIATMIAEALPNTLQLAGAGLLLAVGFGLLLGVIAALRPGTRLDTVLGVASVAFITTPSFVVSIFLLLIFAIALNLFPVTGAGDAGSITDRLLHLVLPATALAIGWIGYLARLIRAALLEVMAEAHVRMLRAYGVPERRIVGRYALRLALIPMIAVMGIGVGDMISNAVFVEIIFSRPGIGSLIYNAIEDRNFPVVQAGILFTVAVYVSANLAVELLNALLDQRIARTLQEAG
jgi:peptide/nickel transport system permease protein